MVKCSFCGENMRRGTGKMFVHTDGRISYFCSMKCEKNTRKLGRNPNVTKWTKRFQDLKMAGGKTAEKAEEKQEMKEPQKQKENKKAG